jgi:hypothetical protein
MNYLSSEQVLFLHARLEVRRSTFQFEGLPSGRLRTSLEKSQVATFHNSTCVRLTSEI